MPPTGKGATLQFIAEQCPDVPIPSFFRVSSETLELHRIHRLADFLGYPLIVRSDAKYEDGLGKSFAGLFQSRWVDRAENLERTLSEVRRGHLEWGFVREYAQDRGVEIQRLPINVLLQKFVDSSYRAIITEHPNVPDQYFIDTIRTWRNDEKSGFLLGVEDVGFFDRRGGDGLASDIACALKDCRKVRALFPDDVVYQAEVTLDPYAFVQWRPFRRKERAPFSLDAVAPSLQEKNTLEIPMVLGVTPAEGVSYLPGEWVVGARISESEASDWSTGALPKLSLFSREGGCNQYKCAPWQSHNLFRFAERGLHIGFAQLHELLKIIRPDSYLDVEASDTMWAPRPARYWSDGRKGRIQILD